MLTPEAKIVTKGILVIGVVFALMAILLSCSCSNAAKAATPTKPKYSGIKLSAIRLSNHAGNTFRLTFGVEWPKGNTSPQPDLKVPYVQYGPGGMILGGDTKAPIVVEHGTLKVIFTGAIDGSGMGQYRPHCYMDEGGNVSWYAKLNATMKDNRAGTVYMNVFDDTGDLVTGGTFEVDDKLAIVQP